MGGATRHKVFTGKKTLGVYRKKRFMEIRNGHMFLFKGVAETYPCQVENLRGAAVQRAENTCEGVVYGPFCTRFHFKYAKEATLTEIEHAIQAEKERDSEVERWQNKIAEAEQKSGAYDELQKKLEDTQAELARLQGVIANWQQRAAYARGVITSMEQGWDCMDLKQDQIQTRERMHKGHVAEPVDVAKLKKDIKRSLGSGASVGSASPSSASSHKSSHSSRSSHSRTTDMSRKSAAKSEAASRSSHHSHKFESGSARNSVHSLGAQSQPMSVHDSAGSMRSQTSSRRHSGLVE
eukprot:TRINITY_DN55514_c0_g2_i1.p2 TRINITY_DN55514_c0_g2~~TRINITY_DN55514_c0_g2_i1.p2  ORF type:complete len:294 (+),score=31.17 TRINITY_DN55514_c0_g2_i1:82-963(+)